MISRYSTLCPRCGRQNLSRARYCAQCGLNLSTIGADEVTRALRRNGRRSSAGLLLFLILLGLFLATMCSLVWTGPRALCPHSAPRPIVKPYHHREPPWLSDRAHERMKHRWPAGWKVEP